MRFFRPPIAAKLICRGALFRLSVREKVLSLSFDDGPARGSTEKILDILDSRRIRALFFCTGVAAEANPELMGRIRAAGHLTGNHGYHHLDGFKTPLNEYYDNVIAAEPFTSSKIFRPPYGRLTIGQYKKLKKRYSIVFWDIMPYDFDPGLSADRSYEILVNGIRNGSLIVLHDTLKSSARDYLERFIDHSLAQGFRFTIPEALFR